MSKRFEKSIYTDELQDKYNIHPNWSKSLIERKTYTCFICQEKEYRYPTRLKNHLRQCMKDYHLKTFTDEELRMANYRYNYGINFTYEMIYKMYVIDRVGSWEMQRIFGGVHHRVTEFLRWYYKIQPRNLSKVMKQNYVLEKKTETMMRLYGSTSHRIESIEKLKNVFDFKKYYLGIVQESFLPKKLSKKDIVIESFLPSDDYYFNRLSKAINRFYIQNDDDDNFF
ncbi:MAG: hypothetical protein PHT94_05065 [Candidatus Nanoarchaeia archaeon]|nr:hypothetical protein [Candidatus Nanoarchaeia archaeon]